eukprot:jgi/Chrzof1/14053/Cz08g22210.t1
MRRIALRTGVIGLGSSIPSRFVFSRRTHMFTSLAAMPAVHDHTTLSNYLDIRVVHSDYELDVQFTSKVIEGYAKLSCSVMSSSATKLRLDTSNLSVHGVTLVDTEQELNWIFDKQHEALGTPLDIGLPDGMQQGSQFSVGIRFSTSPSSSALQYLEPSQTAGGKHPYLFTQCQAIHARAFVPCQDTPAVKSTYTAAVRVPAELTALMSAVPIDDKQDQQQQPQQQQDGVPHLVDVPTPKYVTKVFHFEQKVPIPSYLLALAVGELECRELSPRSKVWSEPAMVEAGAYEFAETAKFLEAGESLAGDYVWGRYDLLLLPPSFPYGGMENPCLTFVTPTLLAGDRSLTNVVAHEIAHSWTGNLVTNASWEHFWLNEGWTVFLERKIIGRLQGEKALQFAASSGAVFLAEEVARIGSSHNFTRLIPDLSGGKDPDDAFSRVPYEKGFYFLYYLQDVVGGPSAFEPFMRSYLTHFAFKTVDSYQFKDFFCDHFKGNAAISSIDWDAWFYNPGMPPVENSYDTSLATAANDLAVRWHTADVMGIGADPPAGAGPADIQGWGTEQVVAFLTKLDQLRSLTPLHPTMTRAMAGLYNLDAAKNCEIRCAWYKLCISAEDAAVSSGTVDLLQTQGRMKFLRPVYRALFRSKFGHQLALDTFKANADKYHPIARKMVEVDLQLRPQSTS